MVVAKDAVIIGTEAKALGIETKAIGYTTKEVAAKAGAKEAAEASIKTVYRSSLPKNVKESLEYLESKNWNVNRPEVANGRIYENTTKPSLPVQNRGYWKEYDVNANAQSPNRDAERFIKGDGGEVYHTDTHYESWQLIK